MDYNKNYYKILEVDKNSDENIIKKSYKKLAMKYHPDKNPDENSENIFKSISEAYSILSDNTSKTEYDIRSPHGKNYNPHPNGFGFTSGFSGFGSSIFDVFEQFGFTSGFEHFKKRETFIEYLDLSLSVNISLIDVYNNKEIPIKYVRQTQCSSCDFTGFDLNSESFVCEMCNGVGRTQFGTHCEFCRGTGKIHSGTCKECNGEKIVNKEIEFKLNNLYTLRDSRTEYLQNYGHCSKYYRQKVGNLQLNIKYNHDNRYQILGNDLVYKLNLHFQDAIDGVEHIYHHLDDKKLKISIPKETKDKDVVRLKNQGLLSNNNVRGDLLIEINVIIDYSKIKSI